FRRREWFLRIGIGIHRDVPRQILVTDHMAAGDFLIFSNDVIDVRIDEGDVAVFIVRVRREAWSRSRGGNSIIVIGIWRGGGLERARNGCSLIPAIATGIALAGSVAGARDGSGRPAVSLAGPLAGSGRLSGSHG